MTHGAYDAFGVKDEVLNIPKLVDSEADGVMAAL